MSSNETPKCSGETEGGETMSHPSSNFDLDKLFRCFEECIDKDGRILLSHYIAGYGELFKFLNLLGTVFGWVSSDVDAKLDVLRHHWKSDETGRHYQDVKSMMTYEVESKLIKPKAKDSTTGTRNLLRLHRALEYIVAFLEEIPNLELRDKCCPASQHAYRKTLEKFHPWIVQKAANLAMHMLPTKAGLIEKICLGDQEKIDKAEELLPVAVKAMTTVYDKTDALYREFDLLNLP